jgi:hypothetical protein
MLALPVVLLIASADPVYATNPELTAEAKASPAADRWMTLDRGILTGGLNLGGTRFDGNWDAAFSDAPASLPLARKGHALQVASRVEYVGGSTTALTGLALLGLRMFLSSPSTVGLWGGLVFSFIGMTGMVLGIIHARTAYAALLEAVRIHNGAVNDSLPEDQRLDLGEFGPFNPPPSAVP